MDLGRIELSSSPLTASKTKSKWSCGVTYIGSAQTYTLQEPRVWGIRTLLHPYDRTRRDIKDWISYYKIHGRENNKGREIWLETYIKHTIIKHT